MDEATRKLFDEDEDDGWCVDCDDDHGDVLDGDEWVCRECLVVRYHKLAEENQRLAAEVERLSKDCEEADQRYCDMLDQRDEARRELGRTVPGPMDLGHVAEVFNQNKLLGATDWKPRSGGQVISHTAKTGWWRVQAIAVAEKLLCEKEAP